MRPVTFCRWFFLAQLLTFALPCLAVAGDAPAEALTGKELIGAWWTPRNESRIEFFAQGGKYFGRIAWMLPAAEHLLDNHNPDPAKRAERRLGMVIFQNFRFDGEDEWVDGTVYNPDDGRTYSAKFSLESKNRLRVRGFFGISLLGRTEIFVRQ